MISELLSKWLDVCAFAATLTGIAGMIISTLNTTNEKHETRKEFIKAVFKKMKPWMALFLSGFLAYALNLALFLKDQMMLERYRTCLPALLILVALVAGLCTFAGISSREKDVAREEKQ